MNRTSRRWLTSLVLLAAAGLGVCAQEPCTVTVIPGQSLQQAIDAAPEGAVLCLMEGAWEENVTIGKRLTLRRGDVGPAVIRAKAMHRAAVHIAEPDGAEGVTVLLDGITVVGARGVNKGFGILVEGSCHLVVKGCTIAANEAAGLWLSERAQVTITDTTIAGNHTGISAGHDARATITDCVVAGNHHGIMLWGRSETTISGCTLAHNRGADILVVDEARAEISDCSR